MSRQPQQDPAADKYVSLITHMQQGFCVVEVLFDQSGQHIDYRFVETNPAYEQQTGLTNAVGKTMRALQPAHEQHWFDSYAQVVRTRQPIRFVQQASHLAGGVWYDVFAFPFGASASNQVAIIFHDITEQQRTQEALLQNQQRQAYLLRLSDALRPMADAVRIQAEACRLLGEQLGVDRAYYVELHEAEGYTHVAQNYLRGHSPSLAGTYALADYDWTMPPLRRGETIVIDDTEVAALIPEADRVSMRAVAIRAHITSPIIKDAQVVGSLCVTEPTPRSWTAEDVELVRETAERIWAAIVRLAAEQARRESERSLRTLVQNIRDYAIFRIDPNGIITQWTAGAERVKGYTPDDVIGKHLSMFYASEDIAAGEPAGELAEAARTGRAEREGNRVHKDGRIITVDEIATAIHDGGGRLIGFTKISRDVTQRRRMEAAAHELEQRTRIAVDAGRLATWEWEVTNDLAYWNEQHFRLLGMEPQEGPVRSALFLNHIHPDDRQHVQNELTKTIDQKLPYDTEFRVVQDNDGVRWMRGYGQVTAELNGQTTKVSGVMFDITERREAEEALREVRERLQIILDSILDHAIITIDTKGIITGWNPGAEGLFGWSAGEILGQPVAVIFPYADRRAGRPEAEMQLAHQQGKAAHEGYHQRKDGTPVYVSGVLSPLYNTEGQLLGYVKVTRDLTERRRVEEALREADRRKDEFLAMLAHELRNPMATIRSGLQILSLTIGAADSDTEATVASTVTMMNRQTDHLVRMVDDLLDVSRISRGRIELKRERVNLVEIVDQAIQAVSALYQEQRRYLQIDLPAYPIYLEGDATRLAQVVNNLLTNGVRYTGEQGQVWLSLEERANPSAGQEAVLQVRDNGIGLTADQLAVIFELFVQVDNSLARARGGLGLGLTLVRRLVEMHGGHVDARSAGLGQGSSFTVYLPTLATARPAVSGSAEETATESTRQRILLIDDNADAALMLSMLLKIKGYETHTRYSGRAGVEAAKSLEPVAILLDIGMPGLDGYDTCRLIREQPWGQAVVVIALSGYGQEEDKQRSREAGFDSHLTKPIDSESLTKLLTDLLTQRQQP